ncbi:uncharacterized protein LOC134205945 [Armigeres subalbatus]|uniref:uncharacterized protein LOC134205945 n=1 Tax=Armigeres subalbatus TaxID=124917 RepID=UPI002ED6719C
MQTTKYLHKKSSNIIVEVPPECHIFIRSQHGAPLLPLDNYIYRCKLVRRTKSYWSCIRSRSSKCNGRVICQDTSIPYCPPALGERNPTPKVWYSFPLCYAMNRRGTMNLHFRGNLRHCILWKNSPRSTDAPP